MAVQFGGDSRLASASSGPRQSYTAALTVLTSVFFIWGFATVLNDTLVPHFKSAFGLDYAQSLLVQLVFYLGYLIMGLPAAKVLERTGYKTGGGAGSARHGGERRGLRPGRHPGILRHVPGGAVPPRRVHHAAAGGGQPLRGGDRLAADGLQPPESGAGVQLLGTTLAPLFGAYLIFGRSASGTAQGAVALTAQQRAADIHTVELPYVLIAVVLLALALLVWRVRLPDLGKETRRAARARAREAQPLAASQSGVRRPGHRALHDLRDRHRLDAGQLHLPPRDRRHDARAGRQVHGALLGRRHGRAGSSARGCCAGYRPAGCSRWSASARWRSRVSPSPRAGIWPCGA